MVAATVSATSAAPIGKPPPSALATEIRSGVRPSDGNANISPVRPMPHWISSAMSSAPVRSHAFSMALASAGEIGRTPPSPWIGSTMIAAVFAVTSRSSADGSSAART